ncbi:MAG TPA: hypothetical protein VFS10_00990, partial [Pyrinomonadaceae bacterium]|nr:hypothetical protein [Pyrinomonadaceae bacterium]
EQEWLNYYAVIVLVRLQELLDRYRQNGVESWRVEKCRRFLLSFSEKSFYELMMNPEYPGREYFSLPKFIWRNRHHPGQLKAMLAMFVRGWAPERLPGSLYQGLRTAKRGVWKLFGRG